MISNAVSQKAEVRRVTIPIDGLSSRDGGALTIEKMILRVEGVRRAHINLATEMAYIEYDPSRCDPERLVAAIDRGGFHSGLPVVR